MIITISNETKPIYLKRTNEALGALPRFDPNDKQDGYGIHMGWYYSSDEVLGTAEVFAGQFHQTGVCFGSVFELADNLQPAVSAAMISLLNDEVLDWIMCQHAHANVSHMRMTKDAYAVCLPNVICIFATELGLMADKEETIKRTAENNIHVIFAEGLSSHQRLEAERVAVGFLDQTFQSAKLVDTRAGGTPSYLSKDQHTQLQIEVRLQR
jgi:hypothetical protein